MIPLGISISLSVSAHSSDSQVSNFISLAEMTPSTPDCHIDAMGFCARGKLNLPQEPWGTVLGYR